MTPQRPRDCRMMHLGGQGHLLEGDTHAHVSVISVLLRCKPSLKSGLMRKRSSAAGFSLVELLVVVTIVLILAGMAVPAIRLSMANLKKTACVNNLQQLSLAFSFYRNEHEQRFPSNGLNGSARWVTKLSPYLVSDITKNPIGYSMPVVHCPLTPASLIRSGTVGAYGCYGINVTIAPWTDAELGLTYFQVNNPSSKVLLAELSYLSYKGVGGNNSAIIGTGPFPPNPTGPAANHRTDGNPANGPEGPSNYLFADGHVETLTTCPVALSFSGTQ
ncbi:MAG: hypothetical protein B9S32_01880 [Verrucomicrobia bacterium Tous-C9LFEB]|nr:MAG: hypothetical protein B9S32_01880 [Verrucomicrobia bacterium Tous-C9LFEB]